MAASAEPMTMVLVSSVSPEVAAPAAERDQLHDQHGRRSAEDQRGRGVRTSPTAPRRSMSLGDLLSHRKDGVMSKPLVVLRPAPQSVDRIFTAEALAALEAAYEVQVLDEARPDVEERFDALLPRAFAIVGQPDLPTERLDRAPGCGRCSMSRATSSPTSTTPPASPGASTSWAADRRTPPRSPSTHSASPSTWPAASRARTGPSAPARERYVSPRPPTRSCSPARPSVWSASATWGGRCTGCCCPSADAADLRPVAARLGHRRAGRHAEPAARAARDQRVRLRAGHGYRRERAPARRRRAGPGTSRGAAGPGQPGRGVDYERPAAPGGRRPVPGRRRRLADEPVPPDHPARSLEDLVLSAHRAAASRLPFARSATWWSTIWPRSPAACRRCGCRWPAGSWSPATAIRPVT
jgi:hypothetical protein